MKFPFLSLILPHGGHFEAERHGCYVAHVIFITPYDKGWVEQPMGEWKMPDKYGPDRPSTNFNPYSPMRADFNVHKLIPAPPMQYNTWDE